MKSQKTFGAVLRRLRESKGLSQDELAKLAKISRVQITRLENDSRAPLLATAQALSDALGVSIEVFKVAPEEPKKPAKPAVKRKKK